MSNLSHDFVTVDMRGLKAALVDRAQAERVSISVVARRAIARELDAAEPSRGSTWTSPDPHSLKVSIRLTASEAQRLRTSARANCTSMGALLAALAAGLPAPSSGASRSDLRAALVESSAELSTLNRSIAHLTALLRQGSVQAAREYVATLDTLAGDVRSHLRLASAILGELSPRRSGPRSERQAV